MKKLFAYLMLFVFVATAQAQQTTDSVLQSPQHTAQPVGLVLSGGGALGFAHIGVIKALEEHGIEAQYVAGASMGAIIGVMYAAGYTADDIMQIIKKERLYKTSRLMTWQSASTNDGMSTHKTLLRELRALIPHNSFDSLERRFLVSVTSVDKGEAVYRMTGGNLAEYVAASAAIPAVFEPIVIDGERYVDGGVVDNLPVISLRSNVETPLKIIAVDVIPFIENFEAKDAMDMGRWVLRLFQHDNKDDDRAVADYLVESYAVREFHEFDFKHYKEIYKYGYDAMKAYIEAHPEMLK